MSDHFLSPLFEKIRDHVKLKHDDVTLSIFKRYNVYSNQVIAIITFNIGSPVPDFPGGVKRKPELKVKSVHASITFYDGHCEYRILDFPQCSFDYGDPKFPTNLYRAV